VALFDVSASTAAHPIREQYARDFEKIIGLVTSGGIVAADIIDDNPLAHSTVPINEPFKPRSAAESNLYYQRRIRAHRARVLQLARSILDKRRSDRPGSHIFEALHLAERIFATYQDRQKLLVVFSDMIEQSHRYDFAQENLTQERIASIIEAERDAMRIPDLRDVEVCVTGAGASTAGGIPSEQILAIRDFWLRYFGVAGANLPKVRYGATLLACP
jgi:hypothetical protein